MVDYMANNFEVLTVFTFRSAERMIKERGSQAWNLSANNARRCSYIVCCRNRFAEWGSEGEEEHGAAFLVGKINSVEPSPERPDRFIVKFEEYALIDPQPLVWPGSRNPVWYVKSLSDLEIDETALVWHPMPEDDEAISQEAGHPLSYDFSSMDGLTIPQAKVGLALTFGVSPENIEIVVRG